MVHRHEREHPDEDVVSVDVQLEQDIQAVEQQVELYLRLPSEDQRKQLVAALERLDDQIDFGDSDESNVSGSGAFGYTSKFSVIGETGLNPIPVRVGGTEFLRRPSALNQPKKR